MAQVIRAQSAGFCMGVSRALHLLDKEEARTHDNLGTLGPIIHNTQVLQALKEKGIELPAETQSITFTFKNEVFKNAAVRMEEWMIIVCIPVVAGDNLIIGEIDQVLIK